jgi:hypothetical protein
MRGGDRLLARLGMAGMREAATAMAAAASAESGGSEVVGAAGSTLMGTGEEASAGIPTTKAHLIMRAYPIIMAHPTTTVPLHTTRRPRCHLASHLSAQHMQPRLSLLRGAEPLSTTK